MQQDIKQKNINEALNKPEFKIKRREGETYEDLYFYLKGNQQTLSTITPRHLEFIKTIITESPKNQFATISFTNDENKKIHHLTQATTNKLEQLLKENFNSYLRFEISNNNNKGILNDQEHKINTNDSVKKVTNDYVFTKQTITTPISQLTKPIIEQLNSIIQNSTNYLGVESTILTLKKQLEAINKQLEVTETKNYEKIEKKLDHKNKLAKQAIETITNFLQIKGQAAEEGADKEGIKQIGAAYTHIGTLLQQQQEEEDKKRKEEAEQKAKEKEERKQNAEDERLKKEEEEKKRQAKAQDSKLSTMQKIINNLSATHNMIQIIMQILY